MITQSELALLRETNPSAVLSGIDTLTGDLLNPAGLIGLAAIPTQHSAPFYYNASTNTVYVTRNGAVLNGYNFGTATVMIDANNVTIKNSTFSGTTGWYSVDQQAGCSGAVIENNTFKGGSAQNLLELSAFIVSSQNITIKNNSFLNAPGDAVDIHGGTVTGNYFSGEGYSSVGAHPDAIWVTGSTGPTLISNNFIDWTFANGGTSATGAGNDCVRITTEFGSVSNVTVTGNELLGGCAVIDAGNVGTKGTFSNINITNNLIGFGYYYDIMPGAQAGVTLTGNTLLDWTNPIYSSDAWNAYQAGGVGTTNLLIASGAGHDLASPKTGTTTLYGGGTVEELFGGVNETIFVGGFGKQEYWGGSGENLYRYLAVSDSTQTGGEDVIANFHTSKDVIDLSRVDASLGKIGIQNFTFIGSAALTAAGGQVDFVMNAAHTETLVQVSLLGDSQPDMVIRLSGQLNLTAANFCLTSAHS